jgi:gliding motility-associated-like protein
MITFLNIKKNYFIKGIFLLLFIFSFQISTAQNTAHFIALDSNGDLYDVDPANCNYTTLNICSNIVSSGAKPLSIAIDGSILYIVDNKGKLWKQSYNGTGNCTSIGSFSSSTTYYGLTVDPNGIVYAVTGKSLHSYNPTTNTFATLGNLPYTVGGDLLFYGGELYMADNALSLIKINLSNLSASNVAFNFPAGSNIFGFSSISVPCSNNQAYAISAGSTSEVLALDMVTGAIGTSCTLPFNIYDTASIAENGSYVPPAAPTLSIIQPTCSVATATINVNPLLTGYVYSADGGLNYNNIGVFSGIAAGSSYSITAKDPSGCVSLPSTGTIGLASLAPVLTITNPAPVCSPALVNITLASVTAGSTGSGTLSYWTNATGTTALSNPSAIAASGIYYIKSTNGTCSDIKPVTVTINPAPVLAITNPASTCLPVTIDLTLPTVTAGSTGLGTISYWKDTAATIALSNPSAIATSGTYYIKSTSGTCSDIKPVIVVINSIPVLNITNPAAVCSPASVDITLPAVTAGSTSGTVLSYWQDLMATIPLLNPNNITVSGTYYIKSAFSACSMTTFVTVTINSTPVLTITNPAAICSPATVDITLASVTAGSTGSGTLSYWTDAAATIALSNPTAIAASGIYYIKSTNGTCSDIKPVTVSINPVGGVLTLFCDTANSTATSVAFDWNNIVGYQGYNYSYSIAGAPAVTGTRVSPSHFDVPVSGPGIPVTFTILSVVGVPCVASISATCNSACTSLVTPTFTPVAAICSGGSLSALPTTSNNSITGTWSPALDNTATKTYKFTPTAGQCATTTTLTIQVNSKVIPTFSAVAAICSGGSLSALPTTSNNSITGTWSPALDNTATKTYTFTPTAGQCATTTTLAIQVNSIVIPTFTAVAAICSGGSLSALPTTSNNSITGTWSPALDNTATKTYTFTPTAGQCATTTTLTIQVNSKVIPTFTAVAAICSGGSLSALPTTSNNLITGTWSPALDNTATKTYTFTPTTGQCATTTTLTIQVNSKVIPTFTAVAAICSGATLSALPTTSNNLITGTWSPALDNTATKTYTFTPTTGQCASTTNLTITVNSLTTPTFTQVAAICSGESLSALPTTSNNSITGTWSPPLDNTATKNYTFTPDIGQCASNASMTVVVNSNVTTDLIYYLCTDTAGQIVAPIKIDTNLSSLDYSFAWEYNSSPINVTSSSYDATAIGVYKVTATSLSGGCSKFFNAEVKESKEATAETTVETDFNNQQQIIVTVTGGLGNYEYQLDDGLPQSSPIFAVSKGGEHTITVIDKLGCNNFVLNVNVLNYPRFFTPNADGYNDFWNIGGLSQPEKATIYIFDRYGKFLKQISPTGRGWDGNYNGVALPASDYWFRLLYQDSVGVSKEFKAHFSLKR